jgi:hypothetical protein
MTHRRRGPRAPLALAFLAAATPAWLTTAPHLPANPVAGAATAAAAPATGTGEPGTTLPQAPRDGEALRVFLMTMGPGDKVWERFGHNALWIHDPVRGTDIAYNYGLFRFDQPGFIRRFVQGRMLYSVGGEDVYRTAAHYRALNRSVWVQELELTAEQKLALVEFLEWNVRPENADYRYDYYRDNCSTRIRDALDRVLGGQIRAQTGGLVEATYRFHTRRLTADDVPLDFGIALASGQPVDRPLSVWEEMFLPMEMQQHFRGLVVRDENGAEIPLVRNESTWFIADRPPVREAPPRSWPAFLVAGTLLGALMGVLGHVSGRPAVPASDAGRHGPGAPPGTSDPRPGRSPRHERALSLGFLAVVSVWLLVTGLLGTAIAGMWGFTDHYVTYRNENVLQANPLALLLLALAAAGLGRVRAKALARWLAVAIAGLALLGVLLKLLPGFQQANPLVLALTVPAHAGMAWGVWHRTRGSVVHPRIRG